MKIKRPVLVKLVLTEKVRSHMQNEYEANIRKYELEIEQLQFGSKKLLQEASKKGPEAQKLVYDRLLKEEKARKDKMNQYTELISQLTRLPLGYEIEHSQLETEVEVKVGDHWDKLMGKCEIVVKDEQIIEIRNEGDNI